MTWQCWCRRVLHRPADMQWRLLSYKGADEDLAITDLQRMEHASLPSVIPITPGADSLWTLLRILLSLCADQV